MDMGTVISYHIISFICIPWIQAELQNRYGYENSHICLRSEVNVKVYSNFSH